MEITNPEIPDTQDQPVAELEVVRHGQSTLGEHRGSDPDIYMTTPAAETVPLYRHSRMRYGRDP